MELDCSNDHIQQEDEIRIDSKIELEANENTSLLPAWKPEGHSGIQEEDCFQRNNAVDPSHKSCSDTEDVAVSSDSSQLSNSNVTYFSLLRDNRSFRLYMLSYLTSQIGE